MNIFKSYDRFFVLSRFYPYVKGFCIGSIITVVVLAFMTMVSPSEDGLYVKLLAASLLVIGLIVICIGIFELCWFMSDDDDVSGCPSSIALLIIAGCVCTAILGSVMVYSNYDIARFISEFMPRIPSFVVGLVRHIVTGS